MADGEWKTLQLSYRVGMGVSDDDAFKMATDALKDAFDEHEVIRR